MRWLICRIEQNVSGGQGVLPFRESPLKREFSALLKVFGGLHHVSVESHRKTWRASLNGDQDDFLVGVIGTTSKHAKGVRWEDSVGWKEDQEVPDNFNKFRVHPASKRIAIQVKDSRDAAATAANRLEELLNQVLVDRHPGTDWIISLHVCRNHSDFEARLLACPTIFSLTVKFHSPNSDNHDLIATLAGSSGAAGADTFSLKIRGKNGIKRDSDFFSTALAALRAGVASLVVNALEPDISAEGILKQITLNSDNPDSILVHDVGEVSELDELLRAD